jgi:hypothetical protein
MSRPIRQIARRVAKHFLRAEPRFFLVIWLFFMVGGRSQMFRDPWTFWHTATGHWVFSTGQLIDTDPFSFTFAFKSWVDHEWFGECLLAFLDRIGGLDMLVLACAAILAGLCTWAAHRLQAAALLLVMWRSWRSGMVDGIRYSAAAALAFIVFGKVLSPQYLIWLFPFMAVLDGCTGSVARNIFLLACLTTALFYPGPGFAMVLEHQVGPILLLNLRNALLIWLFGTLLWAQTTHAGDTRGRGRATPGSAHDANTGSKHVE